MYSNKLIIDILNYLKEKDYNDINIDDISKELHYEKTYIMKKFKKELGITIIELINTIKIERSLNFYNDNNSILKISILSNFNSLEYYSEIFKKVMHVSPNTYKKLVTKPYTVKEKEYDNIINALVSITNLKKKIQNYLNNKKPKGIKKLTIWQ